MADDSMAPADTGDSAGAAPGGGKKTGLMAHIKKNWVIYSLGLGGATLIVGIIAVRNKNAPSGGNPTGVNLTDPSIGHTDTMGGMSSDTSSSMYSLLQGLSSLEAQNYTTLQTIANGGSGTTTTTTPPTAQTIFPWAAGTHNDKSHWQPYVTKAGDTIASLNQYAGWGKLTSLDQSGNNVDLYRNNSNIFQQLGITSPTQAIPVGTTISI